MIIVDKIKEGDILKFTVHHRTNNQHHGLVGIVLEIIERNRMRIRVYRPWNYDHRIYNEPLSTIEDCERFEIC